MLTSFALLVKILIFMVIFSISNKFVDPLRVRDRESPLYLKIRINGLGKYMTFFDGVWYKLIRMESKVELAFKSVRFFKDAFLFFHLNNIQKYCFGTC